MGHKGRPCLHCWAGLCAAGRGLLRWRWWTACHGGMQNLQVPPPQWEKPSLPDRLCSTCGFSKLVFCSLHSHISHKPYVSSKVLVKVNGYMTKIMTISGLVKRRKSPVDSGSPEESWSCCFPSISEGWCNKVSTAPKLPSTILLSHLPCFISWMSSSCFFC